VSALQELARAEDRTLSAVINRILKQYVAAQKKPKAKG
jgi:predicted transcriptional regulator